jgi:hypothetical protein
MNFERAIQLRLNDCGGPLRKADLQEENAGTFSAATIAGRIFRRRTNVCENRIIIGLCINTLRVRVADNPALRFTQRFLEPLSRGERVTANMVGQASALN